MDPFYAAILPLAGVAIGAAIPLIGIVVQARYQARAARLKIVSDLAMTDHDRNLKEDGVAYPLALYLSYFSQVAAILEKRPLQQRDLEEIEKAQTALRQKIREQELQRGRHPDARPRKIDAL